MRDYARISPTFWTRGTGKELRGDTAAQVVAVYLMSAPSGGMTGLFFLALPTIAHETGVTLDEVRRALGVLSEKGYAHYDEQREIVWVVSAAGRQIEKPIVSVNDVRRAAVLRELRVVCPHAFVNAFWRRYREHLLLPNELWRPEVEPPRTGHDQSPPVPTGPDQSLPATGGSDLGPSEKTQRLRNREPLVPTGPNQLEPVPLYHSQEQYQDHYQAQGHPQTALVGPDKGGEQARAETPEVAEKPPTVEPIELVDLSAIAPPTTPANTPAPTEPAEPKDAPLPPQRRTLDRGFVRVHQELWKQAYAAGISEAIGGPWGMVTTGVYDLVATIETHCEDRSQIGDWLRERSEAFARAVIASGEDPKFWCRYEPKGFMKWLNAGAVGAATPESAEDQLRRAGMRVYDLAEIEAEEAKRKPGLASGRPRFAAMLANAAALVEPLDPPSPRGAPRPSSGLLGVDHAARRAA